MYSLWLLMSLLMAKHSPFTGWEFVQAEAISFLVFMGMWSAICYRVARKKDKEWIQLLEEQVARLERK